MANQRALSPSLLFVIRQQVRGKKSRVWIVFKATKRVVGQAIHVLPSMSLSSECFGLFWLMINKMIDSTQLIVSISSWTRFLTLKVAVTLTLTVTLIAKIEAMLRGVTFAPLAHQSSVLQAVLFFCQKKER